MSKIKKIKVSNLKALSALEIDFNGCTAIITGGNRKGKSTFLRSIPDRIRGIRPAIIVKQGESEGSGEMELTTGEKFVWDFNDNGKDKLTFFTKEGYETKVTKEIAKRFFPPTFDIDKFLNSPPSEQSNQLQKKLGVDFTDINNRYKKAYDDRTEKNKEAERFQVKLTQMLVCPKVDPVDIKELTEQKDAIRKKLNDLYLSNKAHNDRLRKDFDALKDKTKKDIADFNNDQKISHHKITDSSKALETLQSLGYKGKEVSEFISTIAKPQPEKQFNEELLTKPDYITPELPDDKELQEIDAKLLEVSEINARAKEYSDYIAYKTTVEEATVEAKDADVLVKGIEEERKQLIKSIEMPTGISFGEDLEILINGFPLNNEQISTSEKYCTSLRIASMGLGEVTSLYFDASTLDRDTLAEIETWANERDLQLLIERADFDNGQIKYEFIEN